MLGDNKEAPHMPTIPTQGLDSKARSACLTFAVEIMKSQKYGPETTIDGPSQTIGKLYEKLKELALDVRSGG
jgi:hypothetical protein